MLIADLNDERIVVHAPNGTEHALELAAIQAHMKPADLARRLLLDGLRANGYVLAEAAHTAPGR